ncbi:MAG TPA: glutamine-hydrolyzing carbamoyl-phosphate synthase small subunit [Candidatus Omnitrophota bacterium]|nr:glutamine-hydrolyzing carbamoyl-phosphate synthase small subunit [Candidatus Omnitrophota bacterium]HPT39755.1 glutamine-hydrolyzing carbamoyl-phosphate synthase small subunit [Candidatus Omnitrophota bacterium]
MKAILFLEDGKSFIGESDFSTEDLGEVILNTAVVGYQEMITDPANAGKILVFTYPLIGNYGCAPKFSESGKIWVSGLVMKEKSKIYSNWQAKSSLDDFLKAHKKTAIYNLDTRTLTVHLREKGPLTGIISTLEFDPQKLADKIKKFKQQPIKTWLPEVSVQKIHSLGKTKGKKIAVLDLGATCGLISQLEALGFSLKVFPYNASAKQILAAKPKGLVLSSGPENDCGLEAVAQNIKPLIGKLPIFGAATGCQVLAMAAGAQLLRLKLGHRGANYPIARPGTFKGEITVQNHEYVIDNNSLRKIKEIKVTAYNLNDHTIEEIESKKLKIVAVAYNPVSAGFNQVNSILIKFSKLLSMRR